MFEHWVADQGDDAELAKNHAYLLGSFWNPEAVRRLVDDAGNTHVSSEEDMLKSMDMVRAGGKKQEEGKKRKRRKIKV